MSELPAKDRPGKSAWLGPVALCSGLVSWVAPGGGMVIALVAAACGVVSIRTRGPYRVDWIAVVGIGVAVLQALFSLLLLVMELSGHVQTTG